MTVLSRGILDHIKPLQADMCKSMSGPHRAALDLDNRQPSGFCCLLSDGMMADIEACEDKTAVRIDDMGTMSVSNQCGDNYRQHVRCYCSPAVVQSKFESSKV